MSVVGAMMARVTAAFDIEEYLVRPLVCRIATAGPMVLVADMLADDFDLHDVPIPRIAGSAREAVTDSMRRSRPDAARHWPA